MAIACLLVVTVPRVAGAYSTGDTVVWETGYLSGHAVNNLPATGVATGTFSFDAGDASGLGIDYSGVTSPGDPGAFYTVYERGFAGNWGPGDFSADSAAGSLLFGVTLGAYTFDFDTLTLSGPITFSTTGSVPPLSGSLVDLRFSTTADVFNIIIDPSGPDVASYDFAGPFTLTATFVPEPSLRCCSPWGSRGWALWAERGAEVSFPGAPGG
jgi:hypothetical protein